MDEYIEQLLAEMPDEPLRDVVKNIMDEPIPQEVRERLLKPLFPRKYPPTALFWKRKEIQRKDILEEYDPIPPHKIRTVMDYQKEILDLFDDEVEEGEKEGCRFILWRFIRGWKGISH